MLLLLSKSVKIIVLLLLGMAGLFAGEDIEPLVLLPLLSGEVSSNNIVLLRLRAKSGVFNSSSNWESFPNDRLLFIEVLLLDDKEGLGDAVGWGGCC